MLLITDPIQTRRALLTWQRPLEQMGSRNRMEVAELLECGEGFEFSYLADEYLIRAKRTGFIGYPGLPLNAEHDPATATEVLIRRLPPPTRPDFNEFVETFGLSRKAQFTQLSMLAYTGARLVSDSFGIAETFEGFDRAFRYVFDIAGYRRYRNDVLDLAVGEPVIFRHEPENPNDPDAVVVVRSSGARLGYVNRIQSRPVLQWLTRGTIEAHVFRLNGRPAYPRLFVVADVQPSCQTACVL